MSIKKTAQKLQLALNRAGCETIIETRRFYNTKRNKVGTYYKIYRLVPDGPDKKRREMIYEGSLLAEGVQNMARLYQNITNRNEST